MAAPKIITYLSDKLVNLVANLGTERDKAAGSFYGFPVLTEEQALNAYRGAWLPRKIVDIPALDATRRWRSWQADKRQIEKIEAEEKRLGLRQKVRDAMIKARLFGGSAIFLGTGDRDPSRALSADNIRKGGLTYMTVLTRRQLKAGDLERDVLSPRFGKPKFYMLSAAQGQGQIRIDPTRLIVFAGAPLPDPELAVTTEVGWGDSVLTAVFQAITNSDSTMSNLASLVFEAKVDVIRIPEFMSSLQSNPAYPKLVQERLSLAMAAKGINGTLLLDKEEEYESKKFSFSSLPDVADRFLQAVCGAADIPATRLLGQSPAGLSATGESDARNYYDRVQAMQELDIGPEMELADDCLIRSALGRRPPEVHYVWKTLWQPTAKDRADMGVGMGQMIEALSGARLINREALSAATVNALVEESLLPGLEAAIEKFGSALPDEVAPVAPMAAAAAGPSAARATKGKPTPSGKMPNHPGTARVKDAAPRTLYVSRNVVNAGEVLAWAKSQGFTKTLEPGDLHVTIAFSREPVDWMKLDSFWSGGDDKGQLIVAPGGARLMEKFGDATVLLFNSSELAWRHMDIKEAGASWDFPDYQPHISITYEPGDIDLTKVEPYRGRIVLGPEIFAEVDEDWKAKVST